VEVPVVAVAARVPRVWAEPEQAARAHLVEDAARDDSREQSFGPSTEMRLIKQPDFERLPAGRGEFFRKFRGFRACDVLPQPQKDPEFDLSST
jgi:hypothetical protein